MDQTTDNGTAWALSRLGSAIDSFVDRSINAPQRIDNLGLQYGLDSNGNLYQLGQPGLLGGASQKIGVSPMLILVVLGVFLLVKH